MLLMLEKCWFIFPFVTAGNSHSWFENINAMICLFHKHVCLCVGVKRTTYSSDVTTPNDVLHGFSRILTRTLKSSAKSFCTVIVLYLYYIYIVFYCTYFTTSIPSNICMKREKESDRDGQSERERTDLAKEKVCFCLFFLHNFILYWLAGIQGVFSLCVFVRIRYCSKWQRQVPKIQRKSEKKESESRSGMRDNERQTQTYRLTHTHIRFAVCNWGLLFAIFRQLSK